jgi:Contractile injection system tube protein
MSNFQPASAKLTIGSLDDSTTVSAQYNPKELQVDMTVPWKKPEAATKTGNQTGGGGSSPLEVEFTGAEGRSVTIEMLFDGYEKDGGRAVDVKKAVEDLTKLATVREPDSNDEQKRRPHHCVISWGQRGLPKFECVIESLSTKYSMFSSEGEPLRATCTVKLKEASVKK